MLRFAVRFHPRCHPRESGDPVAAWVPAFAGMTPGIAVRASGDSLILALAQGGFTSGPQSHG
jgi:hypothetical protein